MSFFSLSRNKYSSSSGADRQDGNGLDPQAPHSPEQPATYAIDAQKSPGSARRRLSKRLRISSSSSRTAGITTGTTYISGSRFVSGSPTVLHNNALNLGNISTSPLTMNFGSDAHGPAQPGAAGSPPRHSEQLPQRAFPLLSSPPRDGSAALASAPASAPSQPAVSEGAALEALVDKYHSTRQRIVADEAALAFDHNCRKNATEAEVLADAVLHRLRAHDRDGVFSLADPHPGYGNQTHAAFPGDHFLTNVPLIANTQLLRAARHMPKGAHLHIHFNACLEPKVLLELASKMDRMFITSDRPLVFREGGGAGSSRTNHRTENFFLCEIQFTILSCEKEKEKPGILFERNYKDRQTMPFQKFLEQFPEEEMRMPAMDWLVSKLVFGEEETYDIPQTSWGAWERFNGRTRMMKGLFNYVSVYRKYTELFLQNLLDDNIQYAEIRPNFMTTNQLWNDEGTAQLDNAGIVELIKGACDDFKARHHDRHFDGIKIIYCTPRSFPPAKVRQALVECLEFKQRWPDYIAGFDLVGEEAKGLPLKTFVPDFLWFQDACRKARVEIPFLFHCGETLDIGTDVDGNLVDALLLGAKRIGHGFALPRHPHIMKQMKKHNVCVEVCPISNEILGLTPRIGGHAVYGLLANNVPCTINSDNGTLFQSTLSHDFYQVMVGKADMGLFGWRQLAEWSLTHACLAPAELAAARRAWHDAWCDFVVWLLETYDASNPESEAVRAQLAKNKLLAARVSID